jgi:signal transduction histidine kinase
VDRRKVRAILEDVAEDGLRGGDIIRRLRELFGKAPSEQHPLDVNEVVRGVLPLVRSDAIARGISLEFDLAPGLPQVIGDRIQLQQVVLNLIVNGFDAMEDVASGRRTLAMATSLGGAREVQITVCDCGVGLDPEDQSRIFDPFFTTKPGGMGMGLSITRSIVESHGGRLWAQPNADRGVTFLFTLPVNDEPSA